MIKEFEQFQKGINYNNKLEPNFYDLVDVNYDFYFGRQWPGAGLSDDLPQPVFNNINRFITFFVASIMAGKPTGVFSSPVTLEDSDKSDDILNASWKEFEERVKLTWKIKQALTDGAITGDYIAHLLITDDKPYNGVYSEVIGQVDFELIDANNFYVANPNSSNIQEQLYIQIAGRDLISNLKKESKEVEEIRADNDTAQQAGKYGSVELDDSEETGKATYVITYTKKEVEGETRVFVSKCVKDSYIYEDIDLGISRYPVALGHWEEQKNTYHGFNFVTSAIPTQIYINRGFAMAMYNTMTTAFSKLLYDNNKISGWSNKIGGAIGVDLRPGERLSESATYIAPGNMSPQVMQMIDMAQQYMKETVGANDALLGNINPEQASGISISVASKQSGIPLENPKMNMYNWLEDIMLNYYDIVSNLYGERPVVMQNDDTSQIEMFDFSQLKGMYKSVHIDVGTSSYWSEIASMQTLDNLLDRGLIEFMDYLERVPEGYIKDKQELINNLKEKMEGEIPPEEFIASLTPEQQEQFAQLPPEEQQRMMQEAMV